MVLKVRDLAYILFSTDWMIFFVHKQEHSTKTQYQRIFLHNYQKMCNGS